MKCFIPKPEMETSASDFDVPSVLLDLHLNLGPLKFFKEPQGDSTKIKKIFLIKYENSIGPNFPPLYEKALLK